MEGEVYGRCDTWLLCWLGAGRVRSYTVRSVSCEPVRTFLLLLEVLPSPSEMRRKSCWGTTLLGKTDRPSAGLLLRKEKGLMSVFFKSHAAWPRIPAAVPCALSATSSLLDIPFLSFVWLQGRLSSPGWKRQERNGPEGWGVGKEGAERDHSCARSHLVDLTLLLWAL